MRCRVEVETARRRRETYAQRVQGVQAKLSTLRLRDKPTVILRQDRAR